MFDLRVPASMESLPGRFHAIEDDEPRRLDAKLHPRYKNLNRYATDEARKEARLRTWRSYAARNRAARVAATQRWRLARQLRGNPALDGKKELAD